MKRIYSEKRKRRRGRRREKIETKENEEEREDFLPHPDDHPSSPSQQCEQLTKNLQNICQTILQKMTEEMQLIPLFARTFLAEVGGVVEGLYPGVKLGLVVGNFLVLRFLCPAISSPEVYSWNIVIVIVIVIVVLFSFQMFHLVEDSSKRLSKVQRKSLVNVSKAFQNYFSGIVFADNHR